MKVSLLRGKNHQSVSGSGVPHPAGQDEREQQRQEKDRKESYCQPASLDQQSPIIGARRFRPAKSMRPDTTGW